LLLNDTRNNVTRLNEQIRLLIMMQKKTKASQISISKEIKESYKAIDRLKGNLVLQELGNIDTSGPAKSGSSQRKMAKSQQQAFR